VASLPDESGLKGTQTEAISPKHRGSRCGLYRASPGSAGPCGGISGLQDITERAHSGHKLREPAQNALWLAKAKAGDYVKVIAAYLTGLKMIIATPSYHSSIISA